MATVAVRDGSKCAKDCSCIYSCPTGAADTEDGKIDEDKCIGCGQCVEACLTRALSLQVDTSFAGQHLFCAAPVDNLSGHRSISGKEHE